MKIKIKNVAGSLFIVISVRHDPFTSFERLLIGR